MPPRVENTTAQGQPQGLQYVYMPMGYYDMPNDPPPLHEHRDHGINNYAEVALDVPAQAQAGAEAAPPIAVCTYITFPHTKHLTRGED
jgi:hypothetical protein